MVKQVFDGLVTLLNELISALIFIDISWCKWLKILLHFEVFKSLLWLRITTLLPAYIGKATVPNSFHPQIQHTCYKAISFR